MNEKDCIPKRSLLELDNVIDEIIERNPEWVQEIQKIIQQSKNNERTNPV